jgi:nucleoside-diphosphate-sugar epimerase
MTFLVTGATGLLGSHLVDILVERGARPRALVRPGESRDAFTAADVDVHVADISDAGALEEALGGVQYVLHCAARTGPWGPESEYERTNVHALETLVRLAQAARVQRVVHVSSITVHGNDVRGVADETSPLRADPNPYSRSKVAGERLLQRMIEHDAAPVTIVRPGWIYGPRDVASFARFATMIRAGRMIMIGSGKNHVPLIYVRDVADGVLQAAEAADAVGRPYLLVNDEPVRQRDYLSTIAAELDVLAPSRRLPYRAALALGATAELGARLAGRDQAPPVMRYGIQLLGGENRFSIERARRELGFSPQVDLAEGVRRSVEWFRAGQPKDTASLRST